MSSLREINVIIFPDVTGVYDVRVDHASAESMREMGSSPSRHLWLLEYDGIERDPFR
jgi:hypothetical protein